MGLCTSSEQKALRKVNEENNAKKRSKNNHLYAALSEKLKSLEEYDSRYHGNFEEYSQEINRRFINNMKSEVVLRSPVSYKVKMQ